LGALLLAIGALGLCAVSLRGGVAERAPVPVSWLPAVVRQGQAVVVVVGPEETPRSPAESVVAVRGTLAGEPLRFERGPDGRFRALGAVPVSAGPTVLLPLVVVRAGGDTAPQSARLPVVRGDFEIVSLRLADTMIKPPESERPRIEAERRALRQALARTAATPRLWREPFELPLEGRITDPFGTRRRLAPDVESRHLGLDLAGRPGTPVRAANRGVVVAANSFYFQGNAVYLDHGAGLVTSYLHLSRILVSPGDTVEAGQVIGLVGATGRVTGPHLHWTATFGKVLFDPATLLAEEVAQFGQLAAPEGAASRVSPSPG
jgi:biotin carboxyl carrier protein